MSLTDSMVRKHLKFLSAQLRLPVHLTFHAFRRDWTTWTFTHNVPIQDIQVQGIWDLLCSPFLFICGFYFWPLLALLDYWVFGRLFFYSTGLLHILGKVTVFSNISYYYSIKCFPYIDKINRGWWFNNQCHKMSHHMVASVTKNRSYLLFQ